MSIPSAKRRSSLCLERFVPRSRFVFQKLSENADGEEAVGTRILNKLTYARHCLRQTTCVVSSPHGMVIGSRDVRANNVVGVSGGQPT